jgi:hypothetical protein
LSAIRFDAEALDEALEAFFVVTFGGGTFDVALGGGTFDVALETPDGPACEIQK